MNELSVEKPEAKRPRRGSRWMAWLLVALLLVLHQDYWQWNDSSQLFGFFPWTLAYHVGLSLAAAAVWWVVVTFCWPAWADQA